MPRGIDQISNSRKQTVSARHCAVLPLPAPVHARMAVGLVGGADKAINEVQPAGVEGQNVGEETDPRSCC